MTRSVYSARPIDTISMPRLLVTNEKLRNYAAKQIKQYSETLVVKPKATLGKIVVEETLWPQPPAYISNTVSLLYSVAYGGTKDKLPDHTESWMVSLFGSLDSGQFEIFAVEIYVAKDTGWELVHAAAPAARTDTKSGQWWPAPA